VIPGVPVAGLYDTEAAQVLQRLVGQVTGARAALLLRNAMPEACYGLARGDDPDYLAALAGNLFSLARQAARGFEGSDVVRQVWMTKKEFLLSCVPAGRDAVLAVLANPDTDPGTLAFTMTQVVQALPR
jgi:predicted regulator of Ras-like GTPase activity (Roadblock/LC7/MglB family)